MTSPQSASHSPDLNLTPLAAFLKFLPSAARVRSNCAWNQGVDCNERNESYQGMVVKNHALTVNIFITYKEIQLFMWRSRYSEIFINTYILTYKGDSLRKSLTNHRCYFGFTFEVRFCHVINLICIAISEIGNTNSQVSKPNALMRWLSQLICVSLGGFDANCMHNISTLQNLKKNCHSKSYEARCSPLFPCIETVIPSFRHSRCRCTCVLHFRSVIGSRI